MYELVKTRRQQKAFENIWEFSCEKQGWRNDPYAEMGIRYNLLLPKKHLLRKRKVIGTIEFIPYDPTNPHSTVEGPTRWEFSKHEEIMAYQSQTWEIDKLCIHPKYQRQGYFPFFMHVFAEHAILHQPKYYLALIEKKLYRMLRISFGLRVEQKGEEFIGPDTVLIPIVFDINKIMEDEERISRVLGIERAFRHGKQQDKGLFHNLLNR
ncbi:hypothetical protein [Halalkalibacter nanhaiisediminis]|uniref:N-acetyltransferase domain-containing protein n=1 Tax=Halalkalibacter nanhaiisediminis TaxID=688079 RepID=A0A562QSD5_9BACI|nr:hypothetical protein [Halalkalibacter nanhaiisediminis]TWI59678.1 hypothetical protein IQ10_00098 [Halalkalibacter nanhaiisediminis]